VAAIAAAIVIIYTGWTPIDPILSVLVAVLILTSAWRLMREAAHVLLEGVPPSIDRDSVAADLVRNVPGLREVHHMHVWSLDGSSTMATLHACLAEGTDPYDAVLAVKQRLTAEHGIDHATVEPEFGRCADGHSDHDLHHGNGHGHGHDHGHEHGHEKGGQPSRHYH
jgi:cobalt-zinc-cadmium efflux system protein